MADPQTLLQEKEAAEGKLALTDYELRLAQEDISKLKTELQSKTQYLDQLSGILFFFKAVLVFFFFKFLGSVLIFSQLNGTSE